MGIFKKKMPDRYSLESSLATLIDSIDLDMFTNPKSYIVMTKDYTFACAVDSFMDLHKDKDILAIVSVSEIEPWYNGLVLSKENGMSPKDPGVHMLTDQFVIHAVGKLLEKYE